MLRTKLHGKQKNNLQRNEKVTHQSLLCAQVDLAPRALHVQLRLCYTTTEYSEGN